MYENRPIHWPLSSASKTFVAWVNIHRMNGQTLRVLLADHLAPTLTRLDGELADLRAARDGADKKAARDAERQYDRVLKARERAAGLHRQRRAVRRPGRAADRRQVPAARAGRPLRPRPRRRRDDQLRRALAAARPAVEGPEEVVEGARHRAAAGRTTTGPTSRCATGRAGSTGSASRTRASASRTAASGATTRSAPGPGSCGSRTRSVPTSASRSRPTAPADATWATLVMSRTATPSCATSPKAALAAIETEATRRMGRGKSRRLVPEMRILETGLWSGHAEALWEMELRLAERQGAEIRILAPDEPAARAAFEAAASREGADRKGFLASLVPPVELFDDEDADDGR